MAGAVATGPQPAGEPEKAEQPPAVLDRLLALGVSPVIAAQMVRTHPEALVVAQLAALPHRKPRNQAAALVASVLHRWQLPPALAEVQRRAREHRQETGQQALEASLKADADRTRQIALQRLSGLPEAQKAALEQQALEALNRELPSIACQMPGSRAGAAWVLARMVTDLDA
jgi:hypothetical protein